MMRAIDNLLNKVTMYRLVLYELMFLLGAAGVLGYFGLLPFGPLYLAYSVALIFGFCWLTNRAFAFFFDAPYNPESTWITALILALIITPHASAVDTGFLALAFWASTWAIASKYIFAIRKKHLFNPAALGVAVTGTVLGLPASWWVGTPVMVPFVLLGGLLIVRKIHRFDLWWAFMATFFVGILYFSFDHGLGLSRSLSQSFLTAPAFFFATVMLTEPLTTPPTRSLRILYGAGVALLFLPNMSIGSFYFTPELALLAGNVFSYIVSPKHKLVLYLKEKIRLSADVYEFVFTPERRFKFRPGQYMEWTLAHARPDSRSVRRYFTIASSPQDSDVRLGVKFYAPASSFKKTLFAMQPGERIVAGQLSGDFTLPRNKKKKLVFIAGGIGITPFRSMLQDLLERKERRPITVLYANKTVPDAVYTDLFTRAQTELGIKMVYAFTDESVPTSPGIVHAINAETIEREVPDYLDSTFFISGPQGMVRKFRDMLTAFGIHRRHIKTDYFPGFA